MMKKLDRALGILLALRSGRTVSAAELAARFEVSARTIYRDVDALAELGVPVYAEMGRAGGLRLMEGYFLPPVMFTVGEAISLVLGLTALRAFRAQPFAADLETAEHKLLAAVPEHLRATLAQAQRLVGFEAPPVDVFTLETAPAESELKTEAGQESRTLTVFLQAMLEQKEVTMRYRSPYRAETREYTLQPLGLMWDRDRWYLAAQRVGRREAPRVWRADRVLSVRAGGLHPTEATFDVNTLLGRQWLREAMTHWAQEAPVVIRLTPAQAERLKQDWYYGHAQYDDLPDGAVRMTYGQDRREYVFELLRWLGPGAELLEPRAWRAELRAGLEAMAVVYV
jgi:predicted DNA-binding transcriptional regulator YafY